MANSPYREPCFQITTTKKSIPFLCRLGLHWFDGNNAGVSVEPETPNNVFYYIKVGVPCTRCGLVVSSYWNSKGYAVLQEELQYEIPRIQNELSKYTCIRVNSAEEFILWLSYK